MSNLSNSSKTNSLTVNLEGLSKPIVLKLQGGREQKLLFSGLTPNDVEPLLDNYTSERVTYGDNELFKIKTRNKVYSTIGLIKDGSKFYLCWGKNKLFYNRKIIDDIPAYFEILNEKGEFVRI